MRRSTPLATCLVVCVALLGVAGASARKLHQVAPEGVVADATGLVVAPEAADLTADPLAASCAGGCPLNQVAFVCGADGVTYMTACLATCSGKTSIAYQGPCLPGAGNATAPRSTTGPGAAPVAAPADLPDRHPIASLISTSGRAGVNAQAAGIAVVATPADMHKYASDGFVLVGVVPQADPATPPNGARKPATNPDAEVRQAAVAANAPVELFEMRVDPHKGLLYASTEVVRGGARDLAWKAAPASASGSSGPRARVDRKAPQLLPTTTTVNAGGAAALLPPTTNAGRADPILPTAANATAAGGVTPQISTTWWPVIRYATAYPYRAIGFLQLYKAVGNKQVKDGACTASVYGPRVLVSAAHCIYDRSTKVWLSSAVFSPNHYLDSAGNAVKPYGSYSVKHYTIMGGWVTETTAARAYWYDVAVLTLYTAPNVGYFGYTYAGRVAYSATLYTAGYPGETVTSGSYHYSGYTCDVQDPNGNDSILLWKSASNPSCPRARCPIAEAGQSGQPAYSSINGACKIHAVLSHGPSTYTCSDWDKYTELDSINFDFLTRNRNNS